MAAVFSYESLSAFPLIKKDPISLFSVPEYSIVVIEINKSVYFSSQHCRSDVEMLTLPSISISDVEILCLLHSKPSPHLGRKGFRGSVAFYLF